MQTYRNPKDGRTQDVNETEMVRISILTGMGWRLVEKVAEPVEAPEDTDPQDDGTDQPTGPDDDEAEPEPEAKPKRKR